MTAKEMVLAWHPNAESRGNYNGDRSSVYHREEVVFWQDQAKQIHILGKGETPTKAWDNAAARLPSQKGQPQ